MVKMLLFLRVINEVFCLLCLLDNKTIDMAWMNVLSYLIVSQVYPPPFLSRSPFL